MSDEESPTLNVVLGRAARVAGALMLLVFLCYKPRPGPSLDVRRGAPASTLRIVINSPSTDGQWPINVVSVVQAVGEEGESQRAGKVMWATAHARSAPWLSAPATIPYGAAIPGYLSARPSRLPI